MPKNRPSDYRDRFQAKSEVDQYENIQYAKGSVSNLLWAVESSILDEIVFELRDSGHGKRYLDFACGTGRIISYLEGQFEESVGLDISAAMLDEAKKKVATAKLVCADVTISDEAVQGAFDLITAFRFALNAEPALRRSIYPWLSRRLRDEASLLVINSHGNLFSYRSLTLPYHLLKRQLFGVSYPVNWLSNRKMRTELQNAGLRVERIVGYGFVPRKLLRFMPYNLALRLERQFAGLPLIQSLGTSQIFVCSRLADSQ